MKESYSALARHYDCLMGDFDYIKTAEFIKGQVNETGTKTALDLACGTGRMTILLKNFGITTEGMDCSPEMLSLAFENMRKAGLVIPFVQGKLENFDFNKKYDLITIVCDGLNYVSAKGLMSTMQCIEKHLNANGCVICDVSSPYKLINILGDNFFYEDYEEKTIFWTNKLAKNKSYVDMSLAVFTKVGEMYGREDETHRQYVHSLEDVTIACKAVGLKVVKCVDGGNFKTVSAKTERLTFVIKRADDCMIK